MNLTNQEIPQHHLELLNLRLIFVPSDKKLPFMCIVNGTELCALTSKKKKQIENAELLRQKISDSISGNINFKM